MKEKPMPQFELKNAGFPFNCVKNKNFKQYGHHYIQNNSKLSNNFDRYSLANKEDNFENDCKGTHMTELNVDDLILDRNNPSPIENKNSQNIINNQNDSYFLDFSKIPDIKENFENYGNRPLITKLYLDDLILYRNNLSPIENKNSQNIFNNQNDSNFLDFSKILSSDIEENFENYGNRPLIKKLYLDDLLLGNNKPSPFENKNSQNALNIENDSNLDFFGKYLSGNKEENSENDCDRPLIKEINAVDLLLDNNKPSPFENRNSQNAFNMQNNSEIFYLNQTSNTNYQTIQPIEPLPNEKLLFDVIKRGRKTKRESYNIDNPLVHTKYKDNDIIMKIKVKSWDHYLDHLNIMLEYSDNEEINRIRLNKIDPSIIKVDSRNDNLALLKKKISDIFSGKISKKYKNFEPLYNAKNIEIILQKGDPEIISAVNKTFLDSIDLYCSKRTDIYLFEKMQKIEDDIEKFRNSGENEDYIKKYVKIAKNFQKTIEAIDPRQPRRKEE